MISIEYLAGFFDGEGYVGIVHSKKVNNYFLRVEISQSDKLVLQEIHEKYGGTLVVHAHNPQGNRKKAYRIIWRGKFAIEFLQKLVPYIIVKREQVLIALTFPLEQDFKDKRIELYNKLKSMK